MLDTSVYINLMTKDKIIAELSEGWKQSGILAGDTVLIHSSLKRTLQMSSQEGIMITPRDVLDSFSRAVTPSGSVILPLFNFDFPKTKHFDIRSTPSQMGALSEAARLHSPVVRTGHPIYSFAVIGKEAKAFEGVDNISGYGADSPFAILRRLNGKIACLDIEDLNSMTFYHHVEEMECVDYRYFKNFSGTYVDSDGKQTTKVYKLFVRDIERKVLTILNPAGELMWEAGLYKGMRPKQGNGLRTVDANQMFDFVTNIIRTNRALGLLYRIGT